MSVPARRSLVALAFALVPVAASCGDGDGAATATTAPLRPAATSAATMAVTDPGTIPAADGANTTSASSGVPATSVAPTTSPASAITSTTAATTTIPATTAPPPTTVALPQPEPPPLDDEATEPVVELGRIRIDAVGLDAPLYEGIRLPTFDLGPGHWPGTAQPGQIGNMVIGGHRTSGNADFGDLDQLEPGDEMIVTDGQGTEHRYAVESTEIIDPFFARVVYQTPERTATLFACHPPGSVAQRIVVHLSAVA